MADFMADFMADLMADLIAGAGPEWMEGGGGLVWIAVDDL